MDAIVLPDFSRAFVRWSIDTHEVQVKTVSRPLPMTLNRVRMPIEASVHMRDRHTGQIDVFVLTADCRTEQVHVPRDIWHQPNASMFMIAGRDAAIIEKNWDVAGKQVFLHPPSLGVQPERQQIDPAQAFSSYAIDLPEARAGTLVSLDQIHAALRSDRALTAQSVFNMGDVEITLSYPVKVTNFSERERYFQVDTGPMLFPLVGAGTLGIDSMRRAYIAHSGADWLEAIVNVPAAVSDTIHVHHYAHTVRLESVTHRMYTTS